MSQCSLALAIDVGQRRFTDEDYTDDDAALFTFDAENCPSALIITFDSAAATVALHTSWVKKVQNRLRITNMLG